MENQQMANVTLTVTHADNEVSAFLNGLQVYDHKTEGDPVLNDVVALDAYLAKGLNTLVLVGVNWGGPANFQGTLTIGAITQKIAFQAGSTPNGIAWTQTFVIPA
jgi:hypothetical protein